jgi:hypothetical protein
MDDVAASLMEVARLREGIRVVVREAARINLDAINSMIKARMVGRQAMGFSVSSSELRRFALQLNAIMDRLTAEIRQEVKDTAALLVLANKMRYHHRAAQTSRKRRERLLELIEAKKEESARFLAAVEQGQRRLNLSLRQAARICQVGLSVTRSSKIESAYSGSLSRELRQVSDVIEERIESLFSTVKAMASRR